MRFVFVQYMVWTLSHSDSQTPKRHPTIATSHKLEKRFFFFLERIENYVVSARQTGTIFTLEPWAKTLTKEWAGGALLLILSTFPSNQT